MSDTITAGAVTPIVLTADNAKDKLKEITDKLEAGIKGIFESDQYAAYLKTLSKFHNYSFNNCVLIAMQKPDATHIAGYSAWKNNFKRNVMKGEKGIKIIAPSPYTIRKETGRIDPKSGSVIVGKDGKPEMEQVDVKIPAFRIATVFDISQTEGEPLPEIGVNELTGDVEKYNDFFKALEKSSPVPIAIEDIGSGAKGYYEQVEKRITIQAAMSELQTLKTAIHEIAHARLHDIDKNAPPEVPRPDRYTREVEAESVAFTVCNYYGLDTSDYSFGYIAGWSGDKELDTLKQSLDTIRTEANAIITEVDGHMAELTQSRDEVMKGLQDEVSKTLQMFVNDDLSRSGTISPDTLEAIRVQGYQYKNGVLTKQPAPAVPESHIKTAEMSTEQNLNMIDGVLNNTSPLAEIFEANGKTPGNETLSVLAGIINSETGSTSNYIPTVAELESRAHSGEPVSISELAGAIKRENQSEPMERRSADAKPSIREQLHSGKQQIAREKSMQERVSPHSRDMGERT